ncbi:MAG: ketopantoate reductase family protein [Syntrophales bacterium]
MAMKAKIENVAIIGAGALGGAYASIFYEMDKRCVSFIAAGERYERLRREGMVVNGRPCNIPVSQPDDFLPAADLIIVAVKQHQLDDAIRDMKMRVGPQTTIISVMNGIDSEKAIGAAYGKEKVLYAVAVGIDGVRAENRVDFRQQGKIIFGEAVNSSISERVRRVQDFFNRAGIVFETPLDMIRILWWKFMINVGINQASAVLRAPYGVFRTPGEARELMESAMREVIMLAGRENVSLSEEDINAWGVVLAGLNPAGKTSMLQDVEAGRKTEVEMFAGKVIELGVRHGVSTPVNQRLSEMIRAIEAATGDSH